MAGDLPDSDTIHRALWRHLAPAAIPKHGPGEVGVRLRQMVDEYERQNPTQPQPAEEAPRSDAPVIKGPWKGSAKNRFYHVSVPDADIRKSIMQHGLSLEHATEGPWSNAEDWDSGHYLWDDKDSAHEYAHNLFYGGPNIEGHHGDIWEVDAEGVDLKPDLSKSSATPTSTACSTPGRGSSTRGRPPRRSRRTSSS